jgi:hypothetical protein
VRHHYSVTSSGLPDDETRRFHTFEEANGRFEELLEQAREGGGQVREESYWRRTVESTGSSLRLALDDVGLLACDADCGAG